MRIELAALVMVASGCIRDRLVECGEHLCPVGTRCTPTGCTLLPADAAPSCPAVGVVPMFSPDWVQDLAKPCGSYTISTDADRAVALCGVTVEEGSIGGPLVAAAGFDATHMKVSDVHLTPEGDELFVLGGDLSGAQVNVTVYTRNADGLWSPEATAPIAVDYKTFIGTPSRGPVRHIFVGAITNLITEITEYEIANGTWTPVSTYTPTDLDCAFLIGYPNLSDDGLRLMFLASINTVSTQPLYVDRASQQARFGKATPLNVIPPSGGETTLTEDCGRIYFGASNAIVHANRL